MDISTALDNARNKISSAYSAISDKGGTIPASQNLQNLASAIQSISAGGVMPISMAVTTVPICSVNSRFSSQGTVLTIYLDNNQKVLVTTGFVCQQEGQIFTTVGTQTINYSFDWAGTILTATANTYVLQLQRVGGRIFYIHNDNGVTYKFFDSSYNELTNISVSGLANAYYYAIISGTPSADKFYVYDNSGSSPAGDLKWANNTLISTNITSDTIGSGKSNTATAMNNSYTKVSGTVFYWATNLSVGGCNDWYVGSKVEYNKLREMILVDWFSNKNIWSSVESSKANAYCWDYTINAWNVTKNHGHKTQSRYGIALRSF